MNFISTHSHDGQIGVLVEVQAPNQTGYIDVAFVEQFILLGQDIAIHVASSDPPDIAELLKQPFVKNPDQSILELLIEKSEAIDGSILISRFIRWDTSSSNHDNDPRLDPPLAIQPNKKNSKNGKTNINMEYCNTGLRYKE